MVVPSARRKRAVACERLVREPGGVEAWREHNATAAIVCGIKCQAVHTHTNAISS